MQHTDKFLFSNFISQLEVSENQYMIFTRDIARLKDKLGSIPKLIGVMGFEQVMDNSHKKGDNRLL